MLLLLSTSTNNNNGNGSIPHDNKDMDKMSNVMDLVLKHYKDNEEDLAMSYLGKYVTAMPIQYLPISSNRQTDYASGKREQ
jgi:hypothetical protein